jgi:hypothetical protein
MMGFTLVSQITFILEDYTHNNFYVMFVIIFLEPDLFVKTATKVFTDMVDIITS